MTELINEPSSFSFSGISHPEYPFIEEIHSHLNNHTAQSGIDIFLIYDVLKHWLLSN